MWSLGMILHKMLFFKLPYRYTTEGEATAYDEANKMDKLETRKFWAILGAVNSKPLVI
jgi:hypothetical protein